jgi:hypothetical protein
MADKDPQAELNRIEALKLRQKGHSYRSIGAILGVSHTAAFRYVKEELRELIEEKQLEACEYRETQLGSIMDALKALQPGIEAGKTASIRTAARLLDMQAKLTGTYRVDSIGNAMFSFAGMVAEAAKENDDDRKG